MFRYQFYYKHDTKLYSGIHVSAESAWDGFFNECKYPVFARSPQECREDGISYNTDTVKLTDRE